MIQNDHFDQTNGSLVHLQYLHPPRVGDELDKSSHPSLSSQSWPITAHHGVMWPHADQSQPRILTRPLSHSSIFRGNIKCWGLVMLSIPAPSFQAPHWMQNRYLERHRGGTAETGDKIQEEAANYFFKSSLPIFVVLIIHKFIQTSGEMH